MQLSRLSRYLTPSVAQMCVRQVATAKHDTRDRARASCYHVFLWLIFTVANADDSIRTYTGHTNFVNSVFVSDGPSNNYLFSGSYDKTIIQWDITNGNLVRNYTGHTDTIYSIFVSNNYLLSGSYDETIKQWDISNGNLIRTYTVKDWVNSVFISNNYLFSGSYNKTIKQWDITNGNLIRTYIGHTNIVNSVFVSNNYLFSGSNDKTIKQWDITTGNLTRTYTGHTYWIMSVFVSGNYLFSGSYDNTIKQWDISNGNLVRNYTEYISNIISVVQSVFVSGNYLFVGSYDNTIKQWNISNGELMGTYTGHTSGVTSVFVLGDYLFSGSYDKSVKQWQIYTSVQPDPKVNIPLIIGTSIGIGCFVILSVIFLVWFIRKRRLRQAQTSEKLEVVAETKQEEKIEATDTMNVVESWTMEEVLGWLKQIGLDNLCKKFKRHRIDGMVMMQLSEEDLRNMDVPMGDVKRFVMARQNLSCGVFNVPDHA